VRQRWFRYVRSLSLKVRDKCRSVPELESRFAVILVNEKRMRDLVSELLRYSRQGLQEMDDQVLRVARELGLPT